MNTIKGIVFDIDGTLADFDSAITREMVELLLEIEEAGYHLALISGKPISYVAGFVRQIPFKNEVAIGGENGAVIYNQQFFPPKKDKVYSLTDVDKAILFNIEQKLKQKCGVDIWIQPDLVNLTVVGRTNKAYEYAVNLIKQEITESFDVHFQPNRYIEVVKRGADKGWALNQMCKLFFGILPEEVLSVGDSGNDLVLFRNSGMSIGIRQKAADIYVNDMNEMQATLRNLISKEKLIKN